MKAESKTGSKAEAKSGSKAKSGTGAGGKSPAENPFAENTLEENFDLLQETVEALEAEDISLEDAFRAYSRGMELLKTCDEQIDRVEKQVLKLSEDGELEVFE